MVENLVISNVDPVRLFEAGSERRVNLTVQNVGSHTVELLDNAHGTAGTGFPLTPGAEYVANCSGRVELWALTPGGIPGVLAISRTVVERNVAAWAFKGPVDDLTLARLPYTEAQTALRGAEQSGSGKFATCEWHGATQAYGDPERTAFAMVDENGPLADLVGERILVKFEGKQVFAYVHRIAALDSSLSLTRRLFMALAPLSTNSLNAVVAVVL